MSCVAEPVLTEYFIAYVVHDDGTLEKIHEEAGDDHGATFAAEDACARRQLPTAVVLEIRNESGEVVETNENWCGFLPEDYPPTANA